VKQKENASNKRHLVAGRTGKEGKQEKKFFTAAAREDPKPVCPIN